MEDNRNLTGATQWPELEWEDWKDTATTLHMWTQIVGKTRLALTPLQNHWWNVPLYVSVRGLTTSAMPWGSSVLEIEFDFQHDLLEFRTGAGRCMEIPLQPQSVAVFYARYMATLAELGVEIPIWPMPVEVADPIRFDRDDLHASYDRDAVIRFHEVLVRVDNLFRNFVTGFIGKISPIHFFWGSFDLCCTRFSGRIAEGPPRPDKIQQEAYSHEVSSAGFWPGNGGYGKAAFYSYAAPVPSGFLEEPVHPGRWDPQLGEFILPYDDVRNAEDSDAALVGFLQSSYVAAAKTAHWNRALLERSTAIS